MFAQGRFGFSIIASITGGPLQVVLSMLEHSQMRAEILSDTMLDLVVRC